MKHILCFRPKVSTDVLPERTLNAERGRVINLVTLTLCVVFQLSATTKSVKKKKMHASKMTFAGKKIPAGRWGVRVQDDLKERKRKTFLDASFFYNFQKMPPWLPPNNRLITKGRTTQHVVLLFPEYRWHDGVIMTLCVLVGGQRTDRPTDCWRTNGVCSAGC